MIRKTQAYDDVLISKILRQTNKFGDKDFVSFLQAMKSVLKFNVGSSFLYWYAFRIRKRLNNDYDHITVITGREGVGKSTFTNKLVLMISPDTRIDHVCYKPMDLINAMNTAKKGDTIWLDEGALFLFSRDAMGKNNKMIIKLLTISRQLNLHLIICIPNFFTIDTYIREHRVNSLFHIIRRGKFKYFGEKVVNLVSVYGKRTKNVLSKDITVKSNIVLGDFNAYWPETPFLTKREYDDRKHLNMEEHLAELQDELNELGEHATGGYVAPKTPDNSAVAGLVKIPDFARMLNLTPNTVRDNVKAGKLPIRKIGGTVFVDTNKLKDGAEAGDIA